MRGRPETLGRAEQGLLRLSDALVAVERVASRLMVVGFVGLITLNVGMRYLAGRPIVFAEELAAIMLVWLAFLAISISLYDRTQIGVTLVADALPKPAQRGLEVAVQVIVAAILLVLLWKSVLWVNSPTIAFERVITTGWPKWPFFIVVPVFCITALVHVVGQILRPGRAHREVTL